MAASGTGRQMGPEQQEVEPNLLTHLPWLAETLLSSFSTQNQSLILHIHVNIGYMGVSRPLPFEDARSKLGPGGRFSAYTLGSPGKKNTLDPIFL